MLSIYDWQLLEGSGNPGDSALIANAAGQGTGPLAGVWYDLDVAWGPSPTDKPLAYSVTLSGATLDTSYSWPSAAHRTNTGALTGIDTGWSPNGRAVYLPGGSVALAYYRIQFAAAGAVTLTLAPAGAINLTVGNPPVVISPAFSILQTQLLGRIPSKLAQLSFSGVYPTGGLVLTPSMLGLSAGLVATINDTAAYRFFWDPAAGILHVYTAAGEVTGAIAFTTDALFMGTAG